MKDSQPSTSGGLNVDGSKLPSPKKERKEQKRNGGARSSKFVRQAGGIPRYSPSSLPVARLAYLAYRTLPNTLTVFLN